MPWTVLVVFAVFEIYGVMVGRILRLHSCWWACSSSKVRTLNKDLWIFDLYAYYCLYICRTWCNSVKKKKKFSCNRRLRSFNRSVAHQISNITSSCVPINTYYRSRWYLPAAYYYRLPADDIVSSSEHYECVFIKIYWYSCIATVVGMDFHEGPFIRGEFKRVIGLFYGLVISSFLNSANWPLLPRQGRRLPFSRCHSLRNEAKLVNPGLSGTNT